ncbi:hypothetical protein EVJ58_g10070 [Rhodofomes roseus]|uniref:Uncharacterized protein n=1 Tax=Rhodofomes roseus TaxID=34475 RepID=A0A4Y9XPV9_9APHY|nr:hypothetical protein EVJ58_g10070 [Rhodofomes roseus]
MEVHPSMASASSSHHASDEGGHEKFYTAPEIQPVLEEQAEEWNKTRAAKRVSLVKVPPDLRISVLFGKHGRSASESISEATATAPSSPISPEKRTLLLPGKPPRRPRLPRRGVPPAGTVLLTHNDDTDRHPRATSFCAPIGPPPAFRTGRPEGPDRRTALLSQLTRAMSDNVNTPARNSHRKTFSFLSSSWFTSKPPLQPAAQHPTDSARDERRVDRTPTPAPPAASTRSRDTDDTSYSRTPHSPLSAHFLLPKPSLQNMRLARKVKKLNRDADDKSKSKQRPRVGDMLEDPYSLMTMSPGLLIPPSPSPSTTSFLDSEPRPRSLKRSATVGNQPSGHATGQSVGVQRARSIAALPSSLAPPDPHIAEPGERSLSPVIFAPREETSQPPSETSSALYSESLVPSKAPSLIEEEEEPPSPVSEVPTTAVSQRFRNISSDGTGEKSHARLASSTSSLSKATRASKDRAPADVSPYQQEPSGSSSSSQQAPPLIRRRSPSPRAIPVFDGDLLTNPPQRSLSLRRAQTSRSSRRLSLDLRNLSPEPFKGGPSRLKKSRSALATSSKRTLRPDAADELVDSYLSQSADEVEEPVDEKQHALNVRRAKKMMQLFGDKPPKELFQVRSHRIKDDMIDTISILTTVSENRRDSRATFTSVTSSISIRRRLRDSVQSSNSEPPSPLVFSPSEGLNGSRQGTPEDVKENVPAEPVEAKDNAQAEPEPQVEAEPHVATDAAPPATEQAPTGAAGTSISPSRPSVHSLRA